MDTTAAVKWKNHTRAKPCPVCGKPDRCLYTDDGAHRCFRLTDALGWRKVKTCRDGTVVFRDADELLQREVGDLSRRTKRRRRTSNSQTDWQGEARRFDDALEGTRVAQLASELGVTPESLAAISCGWANEADLRRLHVSGENWHVQYPIGAWTFPERNERGDIIGIGFRATNGRKGFAKGAKRGLIIPNGFETQRDPVLVVEGPTDVAACLTAGVTAVGRPSNRGGVDALIHLLRSRDCIVVGENDGRLADGGRIECPGRDGAISVATGLASAWQKGVKVAMPPNGFKDVRCWVSDQTQPEDETDRVGQGRKLVNLLADVTESIEPAPPEVAFRIDQRRGRARSTVTAVVDGREVEMDEFKTSSLKGRKAFAKAVCERDHRLDKDDIESKLFNIATGEDTAEPEKQERTSREDLLADIDARNDQMIDATSQEVIAEAEAMLDDPLLVDRILNDLAYLGVVGERELAISTYLIGTSRLLTDSNRPLAAIVTGPSSTGKSYVVEATARLFPDESVLLCTQLTPQALFYMEQGQLIHRFVVAGERSRKPDDANAEATRALREMISAGRLSKAVPVKENGRMRTCLITQDGPIAFIESTTSTKIFDEDSNRCLLLGTDESPQQTARIVRAAAERAQSDPADVSEHIARHHTLQRLLRRLRVRIPFASALADKMPNERPEARRAINHTFDMIRAVALLHQRQRTSASLNHGDVIDATIVDYCIARKVLIGPMSRSLGTALPTAAHNLGVRLCQRYGDDDFTAPVAAKSDPVIRTSGKVGEYLRILEEAGVAELVQPGKGNRPHIWRMLAEPLEPGASWLPEASELEVES